MIRKLIPGQPGNLFFASGEENNLFEASRSASSFRGNGSFAEPVTVDSQTVEVESGPVSLFGMLNIPEAPKGLVLFVDNESHQHRLYQNIAYNLLSAGVATLTFDLLTKEEQEEDAQRETLYEDIGLLTRRTIGALDWVHQQPAFRKFPLGCFGSRIGAPAALIAAAERPDTVRAVVSCGGHLELGAEALARISAPVLLLVAKFDRTGRLVNQQAMGQLPLGTRKEICLVEGTSNVFEEPQAHETIAQISTEWFKMHLTETTSG